MDFFDLTWADFECKSSEDDTKARFSGVLSTGEKDLHDDIVEPGAFGKDIGRIPLLRDHNPANLIGKLSKFEQDGDKLRAEGEISLAQDVPVGRNTYTLMKQGFLTGMSAGFRIKKGGVIFDDAAGVRRIKKAHLLEGSVVAMPANMGARVRTVKSAMGSRDTMREWLADSGFTEGEIEIAMRKGFDALVKDVEELPNFLRRTSEPASEEEELKQLIAEMQGCRRVLTAEDRHA